MAFFTKDFIQFYIDLAGNNHKDWFDANRKRYEQSVKEPFKIFVQHIINELSQTDNAFKELEAKECIFRINRDIRFSKDKTPYKLMSSAVIAPLGKKSNSIHGVYFEFGPEHVRIYGGVYEIDSEDILSIREGIANNMDKFQKIYNDPKFKNLFGTIQGEKNKIIPKELRGAAEKEPLILNKQWYFYTQFAPELILSDTLDQEIIKCYESGKPLEKFFNQFIKRK